jgi:protein phosphatase PTC7
MREAPASEGLLGAANFAASELTADPVPGTSTLLLGRLDPNGALDLLNYGDSGAIILRPAAKWTAKGEGPMMWPRVVLRSSEQQLYFNCPYQVSAQEASKQFKGADLLRAQVQEGDIVIVATDGVFDNLFDWQVQTVVAGHLKGIAEDADGAIDELASAVAAEARAICEREDQQFMTPFGFGARQEGLQFAGGKLDDIAVVVGVVRQGDAPEKRALLTNCDEQPQQPKITIKKPTT